MRLRDEAQAPGGWRAIIWRQAKSLVIPFFLILLPGSAAYWLTGNFLFVGAMIVATLAYGWWTQRGSR